MTPQDALAKVEVADLIQTERVARDRADWDLMRTTYHANSEVDLSWFHRSGGDFVEEPTNARSAGMATDASALATLRHS